MMHGAMVRGLLSLHWVVAQLRLGPAAAEIDISHGEGRCAREGAVHLRRCVWEGAVHLRPNRGIETLRAAGRAHLSSRCSLCTRRGTFRV